RMRPHSSRYAWPETHPPKAARVTTPPELLHAPNDLVERRRRSVSPSCLARHADDHLVRKKRGALRLCGRCARHRVSLPRASCGSQVENAGPEWEIVWTTQRACTRRREGFNGTIT